MTLAPGAAGSADNSDSRIDAPQLQLFVMGLLFVFGRITRLNDVIIPKLKELHKLNYKQAMLVQCCFFAAYAVIGIVGVRLVKKIDYMCGAVAGHLTMMAGSLFSCQQARRRLTVFSCLPGSCSQAMLASAKWFQTR